MEGQRMWRCARDEHRARSGDLTLGITFSLQGRNAANSKSVKVTSRGCDTFALTSAWHESEGEEPRRSPPRSIDLRESRRNVYKNIVLSGLNNFHACINSPSLLQSWPSNWVGLRWPLQCFLGICFYIETSSMLPVLHAFRAGIPKPQPATPRNSIERRGDNKSTVAHICVFALAPDRCLGFLLDNTSDFFSDPVPFSPLQHWRRPASPKCSH